MIVFGHRDASARTIYDALRAGFNVGTTALAVATDAGVRALRLTFDTLGSFAIDRAYGDGGVDVTTSIEFTPAK